MAGDVWGVPELQILNLLCGNRRLSLTGYAVATQTKLAISTVYRALDRFETHGYVAHKPEKVAAHLSERAPRMLYTGTTVGFDQLNSIRALVSASA